MVTSNIGKGEGGAGISRLEESLNGVIDELQAFESAFTNLLQTLDADGGVSDTDYESTQSFSLSSAKTNAPTLKDVPQKIGVGEGGARTPNLPELFDSLANDLQAMADDSQSLTDKLENDSGTNTSDYSSGDFARSLTRKGEVLDSFALDPETGTGEGGGKLPGLPDEITTVVNDLSTIKTAIDDLTTKLDNDAGLSDTDYSSTHGISVGTSVA